MTIAPIAGQSICDEQVGAGSSKAMLIALPISGECVSSSVNRRWNGTPYRRSKGTPLSGEF
jgi:hypothetical protein